MLAEKKYQIYVLLIKIQVLQRLHKYNDKKSKVVVFSVDNKSAWKDIVNFL